MADVAVTGAAAFDWEDIALGSDRPAAATRSTWPTSATTARSGRPSTSTGSPSPHRRDRHGAGHPLHAALPRRAHDAETLLVDARGGRALTVVTKSFDGRSRVYVARAPVPGGTTTLRRAGTLDLGIGGAATAGGVSGDGRIVALRTFATVFAWARRPGRSITATLRRKPCVVPIGAGTEGQGEALTPTFWIRRSALLALLLPLLRGDGDFQRFGRYADTMLRSSGAARRRGTSRPCARSNRTPASPDEREFLIRKKRPDLVFEWLRPRATRASGVTVRKAVKYLSDEQRRTIWAARKR